MEGDDGRVSVCDCLWRLHLMLLRRNIALMAGSVAAMGGASGPPFTAIAADGWQARVYSPNLLAYTEEFNNAAWPKVNITVTAAATTSPDGTVNAQKLAATAAAATVLNSTPVAVAATSATFSIYVKQGTGATTANLFILRNSTTATLLIAGTLNYSTGVWTYSTGSTGVTVANVGSGWWRLQITATAGITSGNLLHGYIGWGGAVAAAGDFLYAYGAQLEEGSVASTYVKMPTAQTPTDLSLSPATVLRAGYDETGSAVTHTDTVYLTKRVRQVYPNQASFTTNNVALSEYVYAADAITGVTNNSTLVSPKPIGTWGMHDRVLVDTAIAWEIIPFHRDARNGTQVACVRVRATDGTNTTAWQYATTTAVSASCETPFQPEVYAGSLNISALNDASLITLEGEVYPHFGVAASVLASGSETEFRFTNRYYYKHTARFAAPNIICVRSTGNDATGVVSTNEATALATPCLTVGGAIVRAAALLGSATKNVLSGLEVRVHDGVSMGSVGFVYVCQDAAAIKVTRTTTSANRAAANITMGALFRPYSAGNPNSPTLTESAIFFEDVTITRSADVDFAGEAARKMHIQMRNVDVNFSSTGAAQGMKSNAHLSIFGMTATNFTGGLAQTTAGDNRIIRGLTGSFNNTAIDGYNIIGCSLTAARIATATAQRSALIYNNFLPNPPGGGNAAILVTTASSGQSLYAAVVQNLVPTLTTPGDTAIRISGDSDNGNCAHVVFHHNTTPGDGGHGRWNNFYDETPGTARSHTLISDKANLGPQSNSKPRDTFLSLSVTPGNMAHHHGVGCDANYTEDLDAGGGSLGFSQLYPGLRSRIAYGDPLYVTDNATSLPGPVAGSLGGDYHTQTGSPARDILPSPLLAFDLAGNARGSGTQDAGAYQS